MSCTHTESCPLHPKLNASLSGWKTSYCDTENRWTECARYEVSLQGKPVPLALLPNGKMIGVLNTDQRSTADQQPVLVTAGQSGVAVMTDREADAALTTVSQSRVAF